MRHALTAIVFAAVGAVVSLLGVLVLAMAGAPTGRFALVVVSNTCVGAVVGLAASLLEGD